MMLTNMLCCVTFLIGRTYHLGCVNIASHWQGAQWGRVGPQAWGVQQGLEIVGGGPSLGSPLSLGLVAA